MPTCVRMALGIMKGAMRKSPLKASTEAALHARQPETPITYGQCRAMLSMLRTLKQKQGWHARIVSSQPPRT